MGRVVELVWNYVRENPGCSITDLVKAHPNENRTALSRSLTNLHKGRYIKRRALNERANRNQAKYVYEDNS